RELHSRGISPELPKNPVEDVQEAPQKFDDDPPPAGDVVTLAAHLKAFEAEILRSRLEIEGVYATVVDASLERIGVAMPAAGGGARVLVAESDLDRAKDVLAKLKRGDFRLEDGEPAAACPRCGGTTLSKFIPGFFDSLFKYGGRPSQRIRCETCGNTWLS